MITFANPAWLYGLIGLLIPIGIHLLSRKEGKTIYIGSIRHLIDSDTAQFSSIRLNEIILLILRLILLTLLVFILAGLTVEFGSSENKKWLVIERGIEKENGYKSLIDSLHSKGFEPHWLANDLPAFNDTSAVVQTSNYYKLVAEIQSKADTAIVISYNLANRFRGEKTSLPASVKWLVAEPREKRIAIHSVNLKGDSVIARISTSNAELASLEYSEYTNLDFEKIEKIDSFQTSSIDTINISIFAGPEFEYDQKIIQAAIQAIANGIPQKFNISISKKESEISDKSDFVFWLSEKACLLQNATIIGYSTCSNPNLPLIVERKRSVYNCDLDKSFHWVISKRLNEENALEESLSSSLANILLKDLSIYKNKNIAWADQRSISQEAAFMDTTQEKNTSIKIETHAGNEPPLLALLFLFLIAERYVAYKRNQ